MWTEKQMTPAKLFKKNTCESSWLHLLWREFRPEKQTMSAIFGDISFWYRVPWVPWYPKILTDQLTLLAPPDFQTFRRLCIKNWSCQILALFISCHSYNALGISLPLRGNQARLWLSKLGVDTSIGRAESAPPGWDRVKVAAKTWCGQVPTSTWPQARLYKHATF